MRQFDLEKLWFVIYRPRPQYLIEVILAGLMLVYALMVITKVVFLKSPGPIARLTYAQSGLAVLSSFIGSCVGEPLKSNVRAA